MSTYSTAEAEVYIRSHLHEDLEVLTQAVSSCPLRPALPIDASCPAHDIILQVLFVQDVSLSYEERLRSLVDPTSTFARSAPSALPTSSSNGEENPVSLADSTLQMCEEVEEAQRRAQRRKGGGGWRRCLKLTLTDGFERIEAVEVGRARPLLPDGVALGAKLRITLGRESGGTLARLAGVLRLHGDNTQLLGGSVLTLQQYWSKWAQGRLAAMTGRPARVAHSQGVEEHITEAAIQTSATAPAAESAALPAERTAPLTPRTSSAAGAPCPPTLVSQPLTAWDTHTDRRPFFTHAVITEVISDLFINEHRLPPPDCSTVCRYALVVSIAPAEEGHLSVPTYQLQVDLGHDWLEELVGMPAETFRAMSTSLDPSTPERLAATMERVGVLLEGLGEVGLVLQKRAADGMVEVAQVVR